jgi:hypothetical protein
MEIHEYMVHGSFFILISLETNHQWTVPLS